MSDATPNPSPETLDDVAPRLSGCMEGIITGLEEAGVTVETVDTYLLDSSAHRYRVPCRLDGIAVQVGYSASFPAWSERVRAHLLVCFAGARRWSVYEPKGGFQVGRIVNRVLKELETQKQALAKAQESRLNKQAAEAHLAALAREIGVVVLEDPLLAKGDNLEIRGQADKPAEVLITVRTTHAEATRIAREFKKVDWRRKKP